MTARKKIAFLASTSLVILSGCSVQAPMLTDDDLRQAASVELAEMFAPVQGISGTITLDDTVQRAVINNLDNRLARLERSFATRQVEVESLDMLPVLAANAGYTRRSNDGYTTSQPLGSSITGSYSRGSDDQVRSSDLSVSWNVLDFAMGYYNAQQAGNRAYIAEERARRAGMDVIRQAKDSFWRAYAAQALSSRVSSNIADAEDVLRTIRSGEDSGAIPAMQALEQRRTVLENIRQLETVLQELNHSKIVLSQMINIAPGESVQLSAPRMVIPEVRSSLSELEQQAFLGNPSIREQQYRTQIAVSDVKRSTVELFPNISASAQMNYSSDDFLREDEWNSYGLNIGLNLLRLATAPQRRGIAQDGVAVEEARALAVRMAVLAQTHIAYRDYQFARQQFNRVRDLADVQSSISEQSRARREGSASSGVEVVANETSAIISQLRVYRAYADLIASHETLTATVGNDDELVSLIGKQREMYLAAVNEIEIGEEQVDALHDSIRTQERAVAELTRAAERAEQQVGRALARRDNAAKEATRVEQLRVESQTVFEEKQAVASTIDADLAAANRIMSDAEAALNVAEAALSDVPDDQDASVQNENVALLKTQYAEARQNVRDIGRTQTSHQRELQQSQRAFERASAQSDRATAALMEAASSYEDAVDLHEAAVTSLSQAEEALDDLKVQLRVSESNLQDARDRAEYYGAS